MFENMYAERKVAELAAELREVKMARAADAPRGEEAQRTTVVLSTARALGRMLQRAGNGIESWAGASPRLLNESTTRRVYRRRRPDREASSLIPGCRPAPGRPAA